MLAITHLIKRKTHTMQQPISQKSKSLLLGLSLVGILCSCSGAPSSDYDPYHSESPVSDGYTDIEPEASQPYIEDESEPVAIPYEDGELALTQEELEVLEAIQMEEAERFQPQPYPPSNDYTDDTSSGSYRNLETEADIDESMAETESDIRALSQQRADDVAEGASY